ncbi:MAG: 1,4-dihydroxy-2-naphthoate polyprenyltransferase [Bacteroidales bacterium]|nr:1,4-dihydroxy-2-naphthoate polyprenyltransferase [Bacteroidales bacterium]
MNKLKAWISAFRLRTLPLSLSSIILGGALAYADKPFRWQIFLLALVTTLFLQILSNLANDYGDYSHGLDNQERVGPQRSVQSGTINPQEMKTGILVFILLSLASGLWLILSSTGMALSVEGIVFLVLGLLSIGAAIKYTIGKHPYGYYGLGDLFVFLFFGLTGVLGTYYLITHHLQADLFLPASALGCLSTGVLNLNNMRDLESDRKNGKKTLAVLLGPRLSRYYHLILLTLAILLSLVYIILNYHSPWQFIFLIIIPPLAENIRTVFRAPSLSILDPLLKKLALTSLLYALAFGIGMLF